MKITQSNIANLDLNLLRILRAVLETGSATQAARRLHVTQSAISNSLARLRVHFGDPLVIRNGKGLSPTPLAKSLLPLLAESLDQVEKSVLSHLGFNPKSSTRRFTLGCTDAHHFRDVPMVTTRFAQALPKAELRIVSPDFMESSDGLASGEIDAALCPAPAVPPGQPFQELYPEGFAFVVRRDHPRVKEELTAKLFNSLRHIDTLLVQGKGGVGHKMAENIFSRLKLVRDVALSVPSFGAAALAASQSDFVAGIPESLAGRLCELLPLRRVRSPLPPFTFPMCLTWHTRAAEDPGSLFFRNLVTEVLKSAT